MTTQRDFITTEEMGYALDGFYLNGYKESCLTL